MKTALLISTSNITSEGIMLHFNKAVSMNTGMSQKDWWVSWNKIGKCLLPDEYCEASDVETRDKLRKGE